MEQKTLKDLVELNEKDRGHFIHCLDLCEKKAKIFRMEFEFDLRDLYFRIPKTEKEFLNMFPHCDSREITKSITQLFCYIDEAVEKEHLQNTDFFTKRYDDFNVLEQRINLEKIKKSDFLKKNIDRIPRENIANFIFENKPFREDYISSSVIKPEEFDNVVKRFGLVGIMSNLNPNSKEYKDIFSKVTEIQINLTLLNFKERVNVKKFRRNKPELYRNIRELFARYEWALMDLCGHGYRPKELFPIKKEAYRIFIDKGRDAAKEYMKEYKVRPKHIEMFLAEFKKTYETFRGISSNVNTSTFEEKVERMLKNSGVFYRRQIPYDEITKTDKKYIADFIVGKAIIEVGSIEDNFIHTENYFKSINEKRELAENAGFTFYFIDEYDHKNEIKSAISQAFVPKELYEFEDNQFKEEKKRLVPVDVLLSTISRQPIHSPREIYFATKGLNSNKGPVIGNMKKRTVLCKY